MKYIYPVILTYEDDCVMADFPDLEGTYTDGKTVEEALENAEDVLNLMLLTLEEQKGEIKAATPVSKLSIPAGATIALVKADTLAYRQKVDTRAVRKSVSVPAWLDKMAKDKGLNLSSLLQKAIRQELNLA